MVIFYINNLVNYLTFASQRFMNGRQEAKNVHMPVKVLAKSDSELRVRFIGETHTSLQVLRERLNNEKGVDYANYFPGHPDLDEPEFFIRTNKGVNPADLLKKLIGDIKGDFSETKL